MREKRKLCSAFHYEKVSYLFFISFFYRFRSNIYSFFFLEILRNLELVWMMYVDFKMIRMKCVF